MSSVDRNHSRGEYIGRHRKPDKPRRFDIVESLMHPRHLFTQTGPLHVADLQDPPTKPLPKGNS